MSSLPRLASLPCTRQPHPRQPPLRHAGDPVPPEERTLDKCEKKIYALASGSLPSRGGSTLPLSLGSYFPLPWAKNRKPELTKKFKKKSSRSRQLSLSAGKLERNVK